MTAKIDSIYLPLWEKLKRDKRAVICLEKNADIEKIISAIRKRRFYDYLYKYYCHENNIKERTKSQMSPCRKLLIITLEPDIRGSKVTMSNLV